MRGRRSKLRQREIAALKDWWRDRSVEEKAASLGISVSTLYRYVCENRAIKNHKPDMYCDSPVIGNVFHGTISGAE